MRVLSLWSKERSGRETEKRTANVLNCFWRARKFSRAQTDSVLYIFFKFIDSKLSMRNRTYWKVVFPLFCSFVQSLRLEKERKHLLHRLVFGLWAKTLQEQLILKTLLYGNLWSRLNYWSSMLKWRLLRGEFYCWSVLIFLNLKFKFSSLNNNIIW